MLHKVSLFFAKKLSFSLLFKAFLIIFFPNIIFLTLAWLTDTARPFINVDYIVAILLIIAPYSFIQLLGVTILWVSILFDTLMMVIQLFPFMDLTGALDLLPFILNAPTIYKLFILLLCLYILALPFLIIFFSKKTNIISITIISILITVIGFLLSDLKYQNNIDKLFGRDNFFYVNSQIFLYKDMRDIYFRDIYDNTPIFAPQKYDRAANNLQQPFSKKILFIVNESWGQPANFSIQQDVLHNLLAQRDNLEFWQEGHFPFIGATVQGELRELCNIDVHGYALRNSPSDQFSDCLSAKLKKLGYATIALHGGTGSMYDRYSWYPKAGFSQFIAAEQLTDKPRCQHGVCDSALFDVVAKSFIQHNGDKIFFYWLTLSSHISYPQQDIFNHRLQCDKYGLPSETSLCRNFSLQTQFFDDLAELITLPEMKGVEVIVVGDHSPPTLSLSEPYKYLHKGGEVSWIHFKVKE